LRAALPDRPGLLEDLADPVKTLEDTVAWMKGSSRVTYLEALAIRFARRCR
jgi:hypothetical protein